MNTLPSDLVLLLPLLVLSGGGLLLLLIDVAYTKEWPRAGFTLLCLLGALASLLVVGDQYRDGQVLFSGTVYADPYALIVQALLLAGAALSVLLGQSALKSEAIETPAEYYVLLLFTTAGAIVFTTAAELVTLFIGLETMSMGLYCLCGASISRRTSSEAALKYFLLGSFSSAIMLYGVAMVFGAAGTTSLAALSPAVLSPAVPGLEGLLTLGLGFLLVGLVFKMAVVPFHFWCPDVYQGAPTPVTAYMACVIKAAATAVALRVLWVGFGDLSELWIGAVWLLAVLTMTVANLTALRQRSVKRMLAYSSIAHAGYMLLGFLAMSEPFGGGGAVLFYLCVYLFMTMGAFGVVLAVSQMYAGDPEADDISRFNGLASRAPMLSAAMALFLFALAGLPPGLGGLMGKLYVFSAAVRADFVGLVVVAVLNSAVSCFYYLRVIVAMYFRDASEEIKESPSVALSLAGALGICVIGVLGLGLFPSRLYEVVMQAAAGL